MPFCWMTCGSVSQPGKQTIAAVGRRTHARLGVYVLGILKNAIGEHRPNRESAKPNSLRRTIKLWYLMPALLYSPDGQIKRRRRFALVESGDIVFLLPWPIAFTRGGDSRQRDAT